MLREYLIKEMLGDSVIYSMGNLFIRPLNKPDQPVKISGIDAYRTIVGGVILTGKPICPNVREVGGYPHERMIGGEFIIIPKIVYEDKRGYYLGYRIDQVLASDWSNPDHYTVIK
jgi:hypothetical protein